MNSVIFARITKVDEETRTVTGRAIQEVVDKDNEIFDYASSKPNFIRWSSEVYKDSGGKSYGNVRSMHSSLAAGKLTEIEFNDAERAIDVTAKIVDDNEWAKVTAGVMTGFSIGGRYSKKWADVINGQLVQRYTAVPSEISLVDRPCVPTARFYEVHKADGRVIRQRVGQPNAVDHSIAAIRNVHRIGPTAVFPKKSLQPVLELTKGGKVRLTARSGATLDPTADAIRKLHRNGPTVGLPGFIAKGSSVPPQNSNTGPFGPTADTGASNNWNDQPSPGSKAPLLNAPHSASIQSRQALPTQEDETVAALKAIHAAGPRRGL